MNYKKLQELVEAVNTYYAFMVMLYAAVLFVSSHSQMFYWVLAIATPLIAGWTGYLLHGYMQRRYQRHGFKIKSISMSYEITGHKKYILRFGTVLKACRDHLSIYSLAYQWTGSGPIEPPKLSNPGQQLLSVVNQNSKANDTLETEPYELNTPEGKWNYWFVAFNPPIHKGSVVDVDYSQVFHDQEGTARPYIYYVVRTPMEKLELNVKFPKNALPKKVVASYTKPSDSRRPYVSDSVQYDPNKQWATWVIQNPKKNYCYRIDWQ